MEHTDTNKTSEHTDMQHSDVEHTDTNKTSEHTDMQHSDVEHTDTNKTSEHTDMKNTYLQHSDEQQIRMQHYSEGVCVVNVSVHVRGPVQLVGSVWALCPQRRGFDPPLGTFSGRGDFSLGVNIGSNSIPPKTLSDESINRSLVYAHMHFIARTQKILTFMS